VRAAAVATAVAAAVRAAVLTDGLRASALADFGVEAALVLFDLVFLSVMLSFQQKQKGLRLFAKDLVVCANTIVERA
jgi:hypothetical protein